MQHSVSQNSIAAADCNCDKPEDLVESIESIFIHIKEQQDE
jgi:hypothetical protein